MAGGLPSGMPVEIPPPKWHTDGTRHPRHRPHDNDKPFTTSTPVEAGKAGERGSHPRAAAG
ncbi:hypothetical protein JMJ76_0009012, partial [Colletotrichum scovillei]